MVIFLPAMVITILMTIAGKKMTVFGWSENGHFRHRHLLGERTDNLWKADSPRPMSKRPKMYIYAISEKSLRYRSANCPSALADMNSVVRRQKASFLIARSAHGDGYGRCQNLAGTRRGAPCLPYTLIYIRARE